MNLQIFLVLFSLYSTLFSSTNGAPAGESGSSEPSQIADGNWKQHLPFSPEEDKFIVDEALVEKQRSGKILWKNMAKKHEHKVNDMAVGFIRKRSSETLRKHFSTFLKPQIPDWKGSRTRPHGYTQQEEEFINKELSKYSSKDVYLYDDDIWKTIAEKHNTKRLEGIEGFSRARTFGGLRIYFRRTMKYEDRISKEVKARFPQNFNSDQEGTSTSNDDVNKTRPFDLNIVPNAEEVVEE